MDEETHEEIIGILSVLPVARFANTERLVPVPAVLEMLEKRLGMSKDEVRFATSGLRVRAIREEPNKALKFYTQADVRGMLGRVFAQYRPAQE